MLRGNLMKLKSMKTFIKLWLLPMCLLLSGLAYSDLSNINKIAFCGDAARWPPFHYRDRGNIVGYDVDVANAMFEGMGIDLSIEMPPWKRCLSELNRGETYQVAFSSSYQKKRARTFIYTKPYYKLTGYYFYSKKKYPFGLYINSAEDMSKYHICGLAGYNYDGFGVRSANIDTGTKNFEALVEKTRKQRCDVFLARYEALKGFSLVEKDYLGNDIGFMPITWMEGE